MKEKFTDWSKISNGILGRLGIEFEKIDPVARFALYAEIKNTSFDIISISNQLKIDATLFDSYGKSINTSPFAIVGPQYLAQWAVIPARAYIGLRIDLQNVDVPLSKEAVILVATGNKSWKINAGIYQLKVKIISNDDITVSHQWLGELELPVLEFEVTKEMIEAGEK